MAEKKFDESNFDQEVLGSDKPVVVDFWAPWCGPCRMMGPIVEKFAEEFDGKYVVGKVNVDENGDLASKYNIMSIPAIKIFKGGKEVNSAVGVQSREKLLEMIGE